MTQRRVTYFKRLEGVITTNDLRMFPGKSLIKSRNKVAPMRDTLGDASIDSEALED